MVAADAGVKQDRPTPEPQQDRDLPPTTPETAGLPLFGDEPDGAHDEAATGASTHEQKDGDE